MSDSGPDSKPDDPVTERSVDQPTPSGDLEQRVARQGQLPGNRYIAIERLDEFRRSRQGMLVATRQADIPRGGPAKLQYLIKRVVLGPRLPTSAMESERLPIFKALPILASDPLSSVAYGPEAGLTVLAAAGVGALVFELPIAIAIAVLMVLVVISYRQVVITRQADGGSYAVARDYLGRWPAMVAAAALLIDYVLTVSVSVSSGSDALASAFPVLIPLRMPLALVLIVVLCGANLRGVREAGTLFSLPTYLFVGAILALIGFGLFTGLTGGAHHPIGVYPPIFNPTEALTPFLVLTAFASGCSSMTGIEAVSDSVRSFRDPPGDNAAKTLVILGALLVLLFIGVTVLDVIFGVEPTPSGSPTVLAQIAADTFRGPGHFFFYVIQFSTTLVLILAANASFNGFPRLCAFLARDDRLPHRLGAFGDRLVYSAAILFLTAVAVVVVVGFNANTDHLINLYAIGVFTAFTLAQAALVRYQLRHRTGHWRRNVFATALGASATLLVDLIVMVVKFRLGAWVVLLIIPLLVLLFWFVGRHYVEIRRRIGRAAASDQPLDPYRTVVPIWTLDPPTRRALAYAATLGRDVIALNLGHDAGLAAQVAELGKEAAAGTHRPVRIEVETPAGGQGIRPLLRLIDRLSGESHPGIVTVIVPDVVTGSGSLGLLRHPRSLRLKLALLSRVGVVAVSYPRELRGESSRAEIIGARRRVAIVPVSGLDVLALRALHYAQAIADEVLALHVATGQPGDVAPKAEVARGELQQDDPGIQPDEEARALAENWDKWVEDQLGWDPSRPRPQLVTLVSPYRTVVQPVLSFLAVYREHNRDALCTVVLPELITRHWWNQLLHNHRALHIKAALLGRSDFAVADVTYELTGP
ncbi:MAG TPA: APC family permease [Candidatus Dormibacteraeota bacterium]|nr:APC family permease [Candidatus Dormibacteraeota bacterium]